MDSYPQELCPNITQGVVVWGAPLAAVERVEAAALRSQRSRRRRPAWWMTVFAGSLAQANGALGYFLRMPYRTRNVRRQKRAALPEVYTRDVRRQKRAALPEQLYTLGALPPAGASFSSGRRERAALHT